MVVRLLSEEH